MKAPSDKSDRPASRRARLPADEQPRRFVKKFRSLKLREIFNYDVHEPTMLASSRTERDCTRK